MGIRFTELPDASFRLFDTMHHSPQDYKNKSSDLQKITAQFKDFFTLSYPKQVFIMQMVEALSEIKTDVVPWIRFVDTLDLSFIKCHRLHPSDIDHNAAQVAIAGVYHPLQIPAISMLCKEHLSKNPDSLESLRGSTISQFIAKYSTMKDNLSSVIHTLKRILASRYFDQANQSIVQLKEICYQLENPAVRLDDVKALLNSMQPILTDLSSYFSDPSYTSRISNFFKARHPDPSPKEKVHNAILAIEKLQITIRRLNEEDVLQPYHRSCLIA